MNFSTHLKRINHEFGSGRTRGYWYLCSVYALNFVFNRPLLVRLTRRNRYRSDRKLLYTVVTGGYDSLNEIPQNSPNWDYVCVTDNPALTSASWRIRLVENDEGLDPVRLSRRYKILNHLVDDGYDLSVYIDCNFRLRGDLDTFAAHVLPAGTRFGMLLHPFNRSLRDEVELCVRVGKDDENLLRRQYDHYVRANRFDDRFPHVAGGMIIRRPGDPDIRALMETWFSQLRQWSRRDQMAFNFALSRCPSIIPHYIPYWVLRCYFKKMDHLGG